MKLVIPIMMLLLCWQGSFGQAGYSGFIDKYPIELATNIYSDGVARAVYAYSNHDEPISISGTLQGSKLTLYEKDMSGKNKSVLIFTDYKKESELLTGSWKDLVTGKELRITLNKHFDVDDEDKAINNAEMIQTGSLKDKYFKVVISKDKGSSRAIVSAVKIFEKKTDKLLQQIETECQLSGLGNISTGDFNFDGLPDFSVFENSYAGPNTSSLYYLYNPKDGKYFDSGFSGTSLEFDSKTKRINEHNQCCAGSKHMNAQYKVVNNKMVLLSKTCLEYDEKKDDFKKVKCE